MVSVQYGPEVERAVAVLLELADNGEVAEAALDRTVARLQVPAMAYREVRAELEDRGIAVVPSDEASTAEPDGRSRRSAGSFTGDGFAHFLRVAGGHRLLTAEEEADLGHRVQQGANAEKILCDQAQDLPPEVVKKLLARVDDGMRAKHELIRCNMRLVVHMAKRFHPRTRRLSLEFEDLVQEGVTGLNRAAEKFDPTKGFKFSTYATWWIRQSMQRAISTQGRLIRLPVHVEEQIGKVRTMMARAERENRRLSVVDVAEALSMNEGRAADLLLLATGGGVGAIRSIDDPIGEDGDATLGDLVEDETSPDPEREAIRTAARETLHEALNVLNERERIVIERRYGLEGERATLEELGHLFGLTRERIRQIEKVAFGKLRKSQVTRRLDGLADVFSDGTLWDRPVAERPEVDQFPHLSPQQLMVVGEKLHLLPPLERQLITELYLTSGAADTSVLARQFGHPVGQLRTLTRAALSRLFPPELDTAEVQRVLAS
jgi:RNA polymerase primary sigma factor